MASLSYDINKYQNMGLLYGAAQTTVFDETGRPVNRNARFPIYTQPVFFGIKRLNYWVNSNQPMNFQFIGVDKKGSPVNSSAKVKIIRYYQNVFINNLCDNFINKITSHLYDKLSDINYMFHEINMKYSYNNLN